MLEVDPVLLLSSTYCEKTGRPITPHPLLHEFSALASSYRLKEKRKAGQTARRAAPVQ